MIKYKFIGSDKSGKLYDVNYPHTLKHGQIIDISFFWKHDMNWETNLRKFWDIEDQERFKEDFILLDYNDSEDEL